MREKGRESRRAWKQVDVWPCWPQLPGTHACPSAGRTPRGGRRGPLHWLVGHWEEGPGVDPLASAVVSLTGLSWCHGIQPSPSPAVTHPLREATGQPSSAPPQKVAGASRRPSTDRKSQLLAGSSEAWVGLQSCPCSDPEIVHQRPTLGETVSMVPEVRLQWGASSSARRAEGGHGELGRAQNSGPVQYPSQFQCSVRPSGFFVTSHRDTLQLS